MKHTCWRESLVRELKRWFVLLISFGALSSNGTGQCAQTCPEQHNISVNAISTATADADLAVVHIGYKIYGPDAKTAYATASETSNAILGALTNSGVRKIDIESTSQFLQHTQLSELQQMTGISRPEELAQRQFTVWQRWTVSTKPEEAAKVLNTAINAGANESGWIYWMVRDTGPLKAQASAQALSEARMIAEQIAQKSGVRLGRLFSANQVEGANGSFGYSVGNGSNGGVGAGVGRGIGQGETEPLAITSRRVEMTVTVNAIFLIE